MINHQSPISGVDAYLDKYVATAGYDNKVILWDARTNTSISCGFHDHLANQCVFSQCGNYLASSSSDYTARIWSLPEMRLLTVLLGHEDDVEGIAFNENQSLIATTSRDHKVRLFDISGKLIKKLTGHTQDVLSVGWLDNEQIVTSSDDGTIKFWNIHTGQFTKDINLKEVETDTIVIVNSRVIISGNDDGEIIIFNDSEEINRIKAHQSGIKRLCFNSKKNLLISSSYDRFFKLWTITDGKELIEILSEPVPSVVWPRSCAFLGEDKIIFSTFGTSYAEYNYAHKHWNLKQVADTYGINSVLSVKENIYTIGDAGILKKNGKKVIKLPSLCNFLVNVGDSIYTGGQSGEIFNALTGEIIYQHNSPINCGAFFKLEGKDHVVFGSYTGEGLLFVRNKTDITFVTTIRLGDNAIKGVAASSHYIFSVCAAGSAYFYSVENFQLLKHIKRAHDKIANGCAFLKENTFASISRDLTLRLTSLNDQIVIKTPHLNSIKSIAVSDDKNYIATGGYHGYVYVYDLSSQNWLSFRPTIKGISSLCYSKELNAFLVSSYGGEIFSISVKNQKVDIIVENNY